MNTYYKAYFYIMNVKLVRLDHTSRFGDYARSISRRVITVAILLITTSDACLNVYLGHKSPMPWIMYLEIITLPR